ncbi:MAG: PIN domain-containing protein, partial [Actinobacteria bacterium]|nr:PIN domain-containing protein [Actinomycetota bacterium]
RGFTRERTRDQIHHDFQAIPFVEPTRADYAGAADVSLVCRRAGVQLGAIDALIAQVCIANDLTLLTADRDFAHAARHVPIDVWNPA